MTNAKKEILPIRKASTQSQSGPSTEVGRPIKFTRTSKPKVRTGCLTCKIRRVKCDEAKPECGRCITTGRKCDGYKTVTPRRAAEPEVLSSVLIWDPDIVKGSNAERRAFAFFQTVTAPQLSSYFDVDFWTRLVFQMSHAEAAIRHAMIALGALAEQRDRSVGLVPQYSYTIPKMSGTLKVQNSDSPFALQQYNKAIRALTARRATPNGSIEVALLVCILFICIEFLRGDPDASRAHFRSGINIVRATTTNGSPFLRSSVTGDIQARMVPFFDRLELLATVFGNQADWDYSVPLHETVPAAFSDIRHARDSIVHLMNLSLRFIRTMKTRKYEKLRLPDDLLRYRAIQQQLDLWKQRVDTLLSYGNVTSMDLDGTKVLLLHQTVASIWLELIMHREERYSDKLVSSFEAAVALAEEVQGFAGMPEQRERFEPTFLFDMEMVSPLYFICLKCRHPVVRRRATALLRNTVRREGLWDSNKACAISERVTAIEEKNMTVFDGSEFPPEEDRVHLIQIDSEIGVNPTHHKVTFFTLPYGINGAWQVWQEKIVVSTRSPRMYLYNHTAADLLGDANRRPAPHSRISRMEMFAAQYQKSFPEGECPGGRFILRISDRSEDFVSSHDT